jgi:hypothetical protein
MRSAAVLEPISTKLANSAIPTEDPWNGSEEFLAVLSTGCDHEHYKKMRQEIPVTSCLDSSTV